MRYGIALGSNLGDRLGHLQFGRDELLRRSGGALLAVAGAYETAPVDCPPGSKPFLNSVMEIEVDQSPLELLRMAQQVETEHGRQRGMVRNAPRTIDLDLLYVEGQTVNESDLVLPHPRMHLRLFVLVPLAEIRPSMRLPTLGKTVLEWIQDNDWLSEEPPQLSCQEW